MRSGEGQEAEGRRQEAVAVLDGDFRKGALGRKPRVFFSSTCWVNQFRTTFYLNQEKRNDLMHACRSCPLIIHSF